MLRDSLSKINKGCLAFLLYVIQGTIYSLCVATIPVLVQPKATILELGVYMSVALPFGLKYLTEPLVRLVSIRQKVVLVAFSVAAALAMYTVGPKMEAAMSLPQLHYLILYSLTLITPLTLVDSLAQSFFSIHVRSAGQNFGSLIGFSAFLVLSDFFGDLVSLSKVIQAACAAMSVVAFWITMTPMVATQKKIQTQAWLPPSDVRVRPILRLMLFGRLPFITFEFLGPIKLLQLGVPVFFVAALKPIEWAAGMVAGVLAIHWVRNHKQAWMYAYYSRIVIGFATTFALKFLSDRSVESSFDFLPAALLMIGSSFFGNLVITTQSYLLFAHCRDSNTRDNLSGVSVLATCVWRIVAFMASDFWSWRVCIRQMQRFVDVPCPISLPFGSPDSLCRDSGGECFIVQDGFYTISFVTLIVGIFIGKSFGRILNVFVISKQS